MVLSVGRSCYNKQCLEILPFLTLYHSPESSISYSDPPLVLSIRTIELQTWQVLVILSIQVGLVKSLHSEKAKHHILYDD